MNKLLIGIVKNVIDGFEKGDFKQLNEASLILNEYAYKNGIDGFTDKAYDNVKRVLENLEDAKYFALSKHDLKGYKLIENAEHSINRFMKKVEANKIFNDEPTIKFSIDGVTITNGKLTNKVEKLLNESINNKVLITTYDESNRGIGKSKALVEKANELDCTLVTHNHTSKRYLDELAQNLNIPVEVKYYSSVDSARGSRLRNGKFLVDEGVSKDVILKFIDDGNELLGGFVDLHTNEVDKTHTKIVRKLNELKNEQWVFQKTYGVSCIYNAEYNALFEKIKVLEELLKELN